jgi:hypothetical protein
MYGKHINQYLPNNLIGNTDLRLASQLRAGEGKRLPGSDGIM